MPETKFQCGCVLVWEFVKGHATNMTVTACNTHLSDWKVQGSNIRYVVQYWDEKTMSYKRTLKVGTNSWYCARCQNYRDTPMHELGCDYV
jgi:hypothetical protein